MFNGNVVFYYYVQTEQCIRIDVINSTLLSMISNLNDNNKKLNND